MGELSNLFAIEVRSIVHFNDLETTDRNPHGCSERDVISGSSTLGSSFKSTPDVPDLQYIERQHFTTLPIEAVSVFLSVLLLFLGFFRIASLKNFITLSLSVADDKWCTQPRALSYSNLAEACKLISYFFLNDNARSDKKKDIFKIPTHKNSGSKNTSSG